MKGETEQIIEELAKLDCGDNGCHFAVNKTGQRTNGGCRCLDLPFPRGLRGALKSLYWQHRKDQIERPPQ